MSDGCIFCKIVQGIAPASMVYEGALTIAFIDLRQFHPGHTLVIPRQHLQDVRDLDAATGAELITTVAHIAKAVAASFPNQGMSVWHSIGEAADQEVPHLHFHVHPRMVGDGAVRIYPRAPATPSKYILDEYASTLHAYLERHQAQSDN